MSEDCIFCKIIEGDIPSHKVYEDENTLAFLDVNPVSKGHTLVVPKKHVEDIHGAEGMDYMWDTIVRVANAVRDAFDAEGINIDQNNGELAGQEVFHMHFHVTPRYTGDEIEIDYDRKELENGESIAGRIAEQL
ncbi:MAG: HIT family protein [Candidatus Nanohaloarchaea archaeon]